MEDWTVWGRLENPSLNPALLERHHARVSLRHDHQLSSQPIYCLNNLAVRTAAVNVKANKNTCSALFSSLLFYCACCVIGESSSLCLELFKGQREINLTWLHFQVFLSDSSSSTLFQVATFNLNFSLALFFLPLEQVLHTKYQNQSASTYLSARWILPAAQCVSPSCWAPAKWIFTAKTLIWPLRLALTGHESRKQRLREPCWSRINQTGTTKHTLVALSLSLSLSSLDEKRRKVWLDRESIFIFKFSVFSVLLEFSLNSAPPFSNL